MTNTPMPHQEYPMDEDYDQALKNLIEKIAERDRMLEQLKFLSPAERAKVLLLIGKLDKAIERGEQALADEYEITQNLRRAEEKTDKAVNDFLERLAGAYVHVKYRHPEELEKLEAPINNMPPDEADAFYIRAARLEAGDLIGIIAREGETREQTEEFLKNYRAAQNKKM